MGLSDKRLAEIRETRVSWAAVVVIDELLGEVDRLREEVKRQKIAKHEFRQENEFMKRERLRLKATIAALRAVDAEPAAEKPEPSREGCSVNEHGPGRMEGRCDKCERDYPTWHAAPNELWNDVCRGGDKGAPEEYAFLCADCFAMLADERGVGTKLWELRSWWPTTDGAA